MEIRSGWNSEYAKKKFDVTLDEADLLRILADNGVSQDRLTAVGHKLSLADAFGLLYYSAEIIARQTLGQYEPSLQKQLGAEIAALKEQRSNILTAIRSRVEALEERPP